MIRKRRLCVVAGLASLVLPAPSSAAVERLEPRIVVADARAGRLHVVTLDGERRGRPIRLPSRAPAYLTRLEDGRHVAAVQYEGDRVSVLDGGSWTEPHGDHVHSYVRRPRLTPFRLEGPKPSHVVSHDGAVAIFTDGTGVAHRFGLGDLRRGGAASASIASGRPHHGVAVPLGEHTLVSATAPDAEDGDLPGDVSVRDAAGVEAGRLGACPELHGEVAGDGWAAFACADGVLAARADGGAVTAVKLPYPAATEPEQRAWGLQRDATGRYLVGDFGARALVRIDRVSGEATTLPLPAELASFSVDDDRLVALTVDGRVHRFGVRDGARRAAARVVGRFDPDGSKPIPAVTMGAGRVAVSDPSRGRVHVLRAGSLERAAVARVGGKPQRMTIVGAPR